MFLEPNIVGLCDPFVVTSETENKEKWLKVTTNQGFKMFIPFEQEFLYKGMWIVFPVDTDIDVLVLDGNHSSISKNKQ